MEYIVTISSSQVMVKIIYASVQLPLFFTYFTDNTVINCNIHDIMKIYLQILRLISASKYSPDVPGAAEDPCVYSKHL